MNSRTVAIIVSISTLALVVAGIFKMSQSQAEVQVEALKAEIVQLREHAPVGGDIAKLREELASVQKNLDTITIADAPLIRAPNRNLRGIQIPEHVHAAIEKTLPNLQISRAEQSLRNGEVWHTVRGTIGDREYEIRLNSDGEVVETDLPLPRVPKTINDAAFALVKGLEIVKVRFEHNEDRDMYRVEGTTDAGTYQIAITPAGELWKMRVPAGAIPKNVQDAARGAVEGLEITGGRKYPRGGADGYRVEGKVKNFEYEVGVAATGEVLKLEIPIEALPKRVQDGANTAMDGLKLNRTAELNMQGEQKYEMTGNIGDNRFVVRVSKGGEIVQVERLPDPPQRPKRGPAKEGAPGEF